MAENTISAPIRLMKGGEIRFFPIKPIDPEVEIMTFDLKSTEFTAELNVSRKNFNRACEESLYSVLINGNFFESDKTVEGLLVSGGGKVSEKSGNPKLSGIFMIDSNGRPSVIRSGGIVPNDIKFAVQAGPVVIEPGRKKGISKDTRLQATRTILAVTKDGKAMVFTFKKPVTLFAAQEFILKKFPEVDSALNLDGGPSTASCINTPGSSRIFPPSYPLPMHIKISPK